MNIVFICTKLEQKNNKRNNKTRKEKYKKNKKKFNDLSFPNFSMNLSTNLEIKQCDFVKSTSKIKLKINKQMK